MDCSLERKGLEKNQGQRKKRKHFSTHAHDLSATKLCTRIAPSGTKVVCCAPELLCLKPNCFVTHLNYLAGIKIAPWGTKVAPPKLCIHAPNLHVGHQSCRIGLSYPIIIPSHTKISLCTNIASSGTKVMPPTQNFLCWVLELQS
jgi:hypothetical protein